MTPDELRMTIPALDGVMYLSTGAHSPSPHPIMERTTKFLECHEYESPGGDGPYSTTLDAYEAAHENVAAFIDAETEEVVLAQSTISSINRVAAALDWEPGSVVVRADLKYPAGILPWRWSERRGVEVRVVESEAGRLDMNQCAEAVSDADLVCFNSLTWNYGTRLPVRKLIDVACNASALSVVDAVQSFGQYPTAMDDWGVDIAVGAGRKWLLELWDAGFPYVRREIVKGIELHTVGYRGVTEPNIDGLDFAPGARRFEIGVINPASHIMPREAADIAKHVGLNQTEGHVYGLADRFIETVSEGRLLSPHDPESGLVSFKAPNPERTVERFESARVIAWAFPESTAVRASFHNFSDKSNIAVLRDGLDGEWWA